MSLSKRLSQEIFSSTFVTHWAAISWAVSKRKKWVSQWSGAFNKRTPSLGFPSRFSSYDSVLTSSPGLILVRELRPWKLREAAKKRTKKKAHAFLVKHLNSEDTRSEQESRVSLLEKTSCTCLQGTRMSRYPMPIMLLPPDYLAGIKLILQCDNKMQLSRWQIR